MMAEPLCSDLISTDNASCAIGFPRKSGVRRRAFALCGALALHHPFARFLPAPNVQRSQMDAADPAIQRLMIEPIRITGQYPAPEDRELVTGLERREQRCRLGGEVVDVGVARRVAEKRGFFSRLGTPEKILFAPCA